MANYIKAGFARADISPEEYYGLAGFGTDGHRVCNNILDRPMVTCVAITDEKDNTYLLFSSDTLYVSERMTELVRQSISAATGIPGEHVLLVATHTHAGPSIHPGEQNVQNYYPHYVRQATKAAQEALEDQTEAELYVGRKSVKGMNFVRHYVLDDGTFIGMGFGYPGRTRFHTDISDEQLQMIRFARKDARDILMVNWQCHATITSGDVRPDMSADFIAPFRDHLEGLSGCKVAYFQGAAGNLVPSSRIKEENIIKHDHIVYGRALAEEAFALLSQLESAQAGSFSSKQICHKAAIDHSDDPFEEEADITYKKFYELQDEAERRALIKESRFNSVYHAMHVRSRARLPETMDMEINAIGGGDIAFVSAPYEMFNSNGRFVKDNSPYKMTFVLAYCNGFNSYLPDEKAFNYDCYEVNARRFPKGAAEEIANMHVAMLNELKEK